MGTERYQVKLYVAAEARREYAVRTGSVVGATDIYTVQLAELDPGQRRRVLALTGTPGDPGVPVTPHTGGGLFEADRVPETAADWLAIADQYDALLAEQRAQAEKAKAAEAARWAGYLAAAVQRADELEPLDDEQLGDQYERQPGFWPRAGLSLPADRRTWSAEWQAVASRLEAIHERGRAAHNRRRAEREAVERAEREARERERAEWIGAHGSDFLKRAVGAGYDCQRRYVTERVALDLPGFAVDFGELAEWKSRACPSEPALDRALALREAGHAATVVWLTSEPDSSEPGEPRDEDIYAEYAEPTTPREAVVVEGYLGRYTAVSDA